MITNPMTTDTTTQIILEIGHFCIILAFVLALVQTLFSVIARRCAVIIAVLLVTASAIALWNNTVLDTNNALLGTLTLAALCLWGVKSTINTYVMHWTTSIMALAIGFILLQHNPFAGNEAIDIAQTMTPFTICALLSAFCALYVITPITKSHKRTCYAVIILLPVLSLGTYILTSSNSILQKPGNDENTPTKGDPIPPEVLEFLGQMELKMEEPEKPEG